MPQELFLKFGTTDVFSIYLVHNDHVKCRAQVKLRIVIKPSLPKI